MEFIEKYKEQIREINISKGWDVPVEEDWTEDARVHRVPAFLALIHSEISELEESIRMESSIVVKHEFADIVIRTIDLLYGLGFHVDKVMIANARRYAILAGPTNIFVIRAHSIVSKSLEYFRKQSDYSDLGRLCFTSELTKLLCTIENWYNIGFLDGISKAIESKLKINNDRSYKHGNRRV